MARAKDECTVALTVAGRRQSGLLVAVRAGSKSRLLETLVASNEVVQCSFGVLNEIHELLTQRPYSAEMTARAQEAGLPASNAAACVRAFRAELDAATAFEGAAPKTLARPFEEALRPHLATVQALHEKGSMVAVDGYAAVAQAVRRARNDRISETGHTNVPPALDLVDEGSSYRYDYADGEFPLFRMPGCKIEGRQLPKNEGRDEEFLCVVPLGPQCEPLGRAKNSSLLPGAIVVDVAAAAQRVVKVPCFLFVCDARGTPVRESESGGVSLALDGAAAVEAAVGGDAASTALVLL